jgi:hypothetical protein
MKTSLCIEKLTPGSEPPRRLAHRPSGSLAAAQKKPAAGWLARDGSNFFNLVAAGGPFAGPAADLKRQYRTVSTILGSASRREVEGGKNPLERR